MHIKEQFSGSDLMDLGLFLRGLIQIMASDGQLHPEQKKRIIAFAESKGFSRSYIEETIESVLENRYFPKEPPQFNNKETAAEFLEEAARIAICDGSLHPHEKEWLLAAAQSNGLDKKPILRILDSPGQ
jgi:tellurite resistance protein